jgi:hypothetical protein
MRPLVKPLVAVVALSLATSSAFAAMGAGKPAAKASSCGPVVNKKVDELLNPNSPSRAVSSCWQDRIAFGGAIKVVGQSAEVGTNASGSDTFLNVRSLTVLTDISINDDTRLHIRTNADSDLTNNAPVSGEELSNFGITEAYVTMSNLAKAPVFLKVGKGFTPFGSYSDPKAAVYSLNQSVVQGNNTHLSLGFASNAGYELSAFVFENETDDKWDEYGLRFGYVGSMKGTDIKFNVSYVDNMSALNGEHSDKVVTNATLDTAAYDVALGLKMRDFSIGVESFKADGGLISSQTTKPEITSFGAKYDFMAGKKEADLHLGYEKSKNASGLTTAMFAKYTNGLPEKHASFGMGYKFSKNSNLSLDYHKFEAYSSQSAYVRDQKQVVLELNMMA